MKQILGQAIISTLLVTNPHHAQEHVVKIVSVGEQGDYYFEPKQLTIKSGDTVTWVNMQDDAHNVIADKIPKNAENFESLLLENRGDRWSHTFKTSGTYNYSCHRHVPIISAVIIVDKPSQAFQMQDADR